jgi:hypothetical protein
MRKLFSLYKKRAGRDKTDINEDAVNSDSRQDEKINEIDGGAVNEPAAQPQDSGRPRVDSTEKELGCSSQDGDFEREKQAAITEDLTREVSVVESKLLEATVVVDHNSEDEGDDDEDEWRAGGEGQSAEEPDDRSRRNAPQRRRAFSNGLEVLDYIPERIHSLPPRLHENLLGVVAVEVTDNTLVNVKYRRYVDWRSEKIICSELYEGVPDTTVTVSEHVLMEISRGNLNPQIALVSNRVRVSGKVGFGIYFFNLISPR